MNRCIDCCHVVTKGGTICNSGSKEIRPNYLTVSMDGHIAIRCNRVGERVFSDPNCMTGKVEQLSDYGYCYKERKYGYILSKILGKCGKEGRYFEMKQTEGKV
jgi:hypothetical protein